MNIHVEVVSEKSSAKVGLQAEKNVNCKQYTAANAVEDRGTAKNDNGNYYGSTTLQEYGRWAWEEARSTKKKETITNSGKR